MRMDEIGIKEATKIGFGLGLGMTLFQLSVLTVSTIVGMRMANGE